MSDGWMRVLVCFAVKEESQPFARLVAGRADVEILLTGMGRKNADRAIRARLHQARPALVISSGFAGGLNPELIRGNVVFSTDTNCMLGSALREAGTREGRFHAHRIVTFRLINRALREAGAREGRFHCSPTVVVAAADKQHLWQTIRADAVEMESSVIRAACWAQGIPSATVRVISDAAHESLPLDFTRLMTSELKMDYGKLSLALIKAPGKTGELIRFQKRIQAAANRLAELLSMVLSQGLPR